MPPEMGRTSFTSRWVHMPDSESDILRLENQFPSISGAAFAAAREAALASGQSVLHSEEGVLYEVFPDGRRVRVREIDRPTLVQRGSRIFLR